MFYHIIDFTMICVRSFVYDITLSGKISDVYVVYFYFSYDQMKINYIGK